MIKIEIKTREVQHRYCDICSNRVEDGGARCVTCGRDLCGKCDEEIEDLYMPDFDSSYCKYCMVIGEKYRAQIADIDKEIEDLTSGLVYKIELLQAQYEEECEANYVSAI